MVQSGALSFTFIKMENLLSYQCFVISIQKNSPRHLPYGLYLSFDSAVGHFSAVMIKVVVLAAHPGI